MSQVYMIMSILEGRNPRKHFHERMIHKQLNAIRLLLLNLCVSKYQLFETIVETYKALLKLR